LEVIQGVTLQLAILPPKVLNLDNRRVGKVMAE
jgi:hypothetical protein